MKSRLAAAAIAAMLLAGCASTGISLSSTNSPSLSGAQATAVSYSSVWVNAEVTPGAFFGLALLGYIVAGVQDDYRRWSSGASWRTAPELVEDRAIAERDCSQPLGPLYANLRCR